MEQPVHDYETFDDAANAATFEFFEVVEPALDAQWAGGYGMDSEGPIQLQILGSTNGDEISIVTQLIERWPRDEHQAMIELAFRDQLDNVMRSAIGEHRIDSAPVVLPMTLELVGDDRVVTVDDAPTTFKGVSVVGFPAWAGVAEVEHRRVVSLTSDGGLPIRRITTCKNWAMSDGPPRSLRES